MRKHFLLATMMLLFASLGISAQEKQYNGYAVGFYNLENLFDTEHDEGKNDYDFLPDGSYKWNDIKYKNKLKNMAQVLSEMGTDKGPLKNVGCAFIGVSEVENARCLTDLCAQEPLAKRNMQFVHIEGPDKRGVDCALLYNPKLFTVRDVILKPFVTDRPEDSTFVTRGFLTVSGTLADEHVAVIVCHLPSRLRPGSHMRDIGGKQMKAIKDSLITDDPNVKVFIMGDMNDDPMDDSMAKYLKGAREISKVEADGMYNPWWNELARNNGTLMYQGQWNLFDQILMSPQLLNKDGKKDFSTLKYWQHQVFRRDYLFQTEGKYKGNTKRTHAGGQWLNGYSDHLPTVVYLLKEK